VTRITATQVAAAIPCRADVWVGRGADKRISKVVQAPGFIRGINPFSKIENPQAPAFIRGVNLKSKI